MSKEEILNKITTITGGRAAEEMVLENPPDILLEIAKKSCGSYDFSKLKNWWKSGGTLTGKNWILLFLKINVTDRLHTYFPCCISQLWCLMLSFCCHFPAT